MSNAQSTAGAWAAAVAPLAVECAVATAAVVASSLASSISRAPKGDTFLVAEDTTGGHLVALGLRAHGVRTVFTLPGLHIAPINVSSKSLGMRVVDVRTEATAVFAAEAHYRLTGEVGVATITAGPGLATALPPLANARASRSALVVLGGAPPGYLRGRGALQSFPDATEALRPVCKHFELVERLADVGPALSRAFAEAASGVPGPALVVMPMDVVHSAVDARRSVLADLMPAGERNAPLLLRWQVSRYLRRAFSAVGTEVAVAAPLPVAVPRPSPSDVDAAAHMLLEAQRPAIVVGSHAAIVVERGKSEEHAHALAEAVSKIGAPVHLTGSARGLLGRKQSALEIHFARRPLVEHADVLVLAGAVLDFRMEYGSRISAGTRVVTASRSVDDICINGVACAGAGRLGVRAVCDPSLFLIAVAERVEQLAAKGAKRPDLAQWLSAVSAEEAAERDRIARLEEAEENADDKTVSPLSLCAAIDEAVFGEEAQAAKPVLVFDGGEFAACVSRTAQPHSLYGWLDPGPYWTLGCGTGFALAAGIARPESSIVLVWGDGACGYGLAELDTFVRNGIPVVALIGNNGSWALVEQEQLPKYGDSVGCQLIRNSYERVAEGLGADGRFLAHMDKSKIVSELRSALESAKKTSRPVLLNVALGKSQYRGGSLV